MDTKHWLSLGIVLSCLLIVGVTTSFAYFTANITKENENKTKVEAGRIGSIKYDGELTFNETNIYPGMQNIQTFIIEKGSQEGTGTYEIDLASTLPEVFGSDIEITLYKTTTPETDSVTRKEGSLTQTAEGFIKEDEIIINGSPEIVYGPETLTNSSEIILEQADFDTSTLDKTTYYLVYNYKNNGNQNAQQGQTFNGKVTVKLISEINENEEQTAVDYILSLVDTSDELVDDETEDHNIRYIGADPNNYVQFNNELWRIIGVMNNIDDGTGIKETRLRIIRNEPIGNYSWDNKPSGTGSSTSSTGSNDWSDSRLMMLLNPGYETPNSPIYEYEGSLYYNGKSGTCYSGQNGATVSCDFTNTGLQSIDAKSMIEDAVWKLGGVSTSSNITASAFYTYEKGTEVYSGHATEWTGKIGLMYASDYGYATSGGETTNRETCLNTGLWDWSDYDDCYNNDWLYDSSNWQWTLTSTSRYSSNVFDVVGNGYVDNDNATYRCALSPVLYLSSNVKISGGTGSSGDPYILSL